MNMVEKVVEALRDTAAKCHEQKTVEREGMDRFEAGPRTYTVDVYSKEWIAGRLLGMADMLDALSGPALSDQGGEG